MLDGVGREQTARSAERASGICARFHFDGWVRRTQGVSAAFIRELLRKAAVLAAEENGAGGELVLTDRHLEEATAELLVAGGELTKTLLGVDRNGEAD